MLGHRQHTPASTISLREIATSAGMPYPVCTDWSLRIEVIGHDEQAVSFWKNYPDGSYTVNTSDSRAIVELLAYDAFEWEAREIMRQLNRSRRFPVVT
jgi:hypothetical protein